MGLHSVLSCFSFSEKKTSNIIEELCRRFSLAELQSATDNFKQSSIIEHDTFGIVYKGNLKESVIVAIKRWQRHSFWGLSEFKNEVVLLCQLHHPNLISLIGFCIEKEELILVYEYTPNGSLYDHVNYEENSNIVDPLPWKKRLQICLSVARALHYLHTGAKYAIIHRDLHSKNIILDKDLEPKVTGLMLSKRGPLSMSRSLIRVESRVMGTCGYGDPQYIATGVLTEKSDVFSFGVVLLEVVCAKRAIDLIQHVNGHNGSLESKIESIVDPFLKSKIDPHCWKTFIDISERCLFPDGGERPNMGEVEVELEHALKLQEEADHKIGC
ncbi:hypothetical protein RJT34_18416 [Clitoria ternatea]|uniref:Protein kinase domain-containing protein n=1 Tax=Clitoria ternatea TaxID=43366 RepID=A0AAN9JBH9_CLITE